MCFVSIALTVYFEDPFWVDVFELTTDGKLAVSKVTFGQEPKDHEIYEFIQDHYRKLNYSNEVDYHVYRKATNPKRKQRNAKKLVNGSGIGTKAQQALARERKYSMKLQKRSYRLKVKIIRMIYIILMILVLSLGSMIIVSYTHPAARAVHTTESNIDTNRNWKLVLVNKTHPIKDNYDIPLMTLSNGIQIDERIYPELQAMFNDARSQGIDPTVGEGYRSHSEQKRMMRRKIRQLLKEGYSLRKAEETANKWVAKPGTSEHELGIALDINANKNGYSSNEDVYQWLENNAYRYGFILRYPQGKEDITMINYEPWHYRYVGKKAAKQIYRKGITLEEYLK